MAMPILAVIAGLVALYGGGEILVRGAVQLAKQIGMTPLFIGLVIIGFGTSMPELVTSLQAAINGTPDVAWGNIVGSNISNTILILGAAAATAPMLIESDGLKRDAGFGVIASLFLFFLAYTGNISVFTGITLVTILCVYIGYAYWEEKQETLVTHGAAYDKGAAHALNIPEQESEDTGLVKPVLLVAGGLVLLVLGGNLLVNGAVKIATFLGLSEAVIGLTIVAIGTSLPEMVTSVIAALRGEGEIALGNIAGSNLYNILGIGGATAIASPGSFPASIVGFDFIILLTSSLGLLAIILFAKSINRYLGILLLLIYIAYITFTVVQSA